MAEVSAMAGINGTYAPHQGYGGLEGQQQVSNGIYNNAGAAAQSYGQAPPPTSSTPTTTANSQPEIPKDEVGWYFVEQYYTTLSRSPEKLYLFYNRRSQFVSGQETDKVAVCVGQRAINDKIKELDFQDCKVRVTNVDSQASDSNIVIQVIGEISNKSQPHKKFTQTFVLATQTNGYFVLNDIFRFLIEEEDEVEQEAPKEEAQPTPPVETAAQVPPPSVEPWETKTLTDSADPVAIEHDAKIVDRELEKKTAEPTISEKAVAPVNGEEEKPEAKVEETPAPAEPKEEPVIAEKPEKPAEPEHTPAPVATPKPAVPVAAPKPSVPMTWASLAAAASGGAASAVPAPTAPTSAAPSTTTQPRAAPVAKAAVQMPAPPSAPAAASTPAAQSEDAPHDEWTAVGGNHGRQQSRQVNAQQQEAPQNRGYIKNVSENVDGNQLKAYLEQFGEVTYLDVSRAKNCAFVDFKNASGYQAAVHANPHEVGGVRLIVEERRVRPGQAPFAPARGQFQGNRGGARGNANRGNFQGQQQGRGNGPARGGRGRGGAAAQA
ncbi:Hypothetical protein R9X50_00036500 [Acrodontium crateriforme]|uniref:NTF2 and RRM domain-containing protein n=1 Tax=Acrodontium crateriforme TaxID=150365 RepID=A0AAQ3LXN4_9PEZI|nr:Hypothetical protein R9X50_00036500 [Acrodontium crateriforme]